jgi:HEXXH motif-containing protein
MDTYVVTIEQFRTLALGYGSADAIDLLVDSQATRRRLLVLAVVERGAGDDVPGREMLHAAVSLLTRVEREAPATVRALFQHPFVESWFAAVARRGDCWLIEAAGYLGALAASGAARAQIPFEITVPARGSTLVLPGLGAVVGVGAGSAVVAGDGTALTVTCADRRLTVNAPYTAESDGWQPIRRIELPLGECTVRLAVDDVDPYRDRYPTRPAHHMSPVEFDRWRTVCRAAWDLLVQEQPEHCRGMGIALRTVVPVCNADSDAQLSATARDAFGAVALSAPSDPESLAELLVHEFQHTKLGALQDLVDLCVSGGVPRFHAPWRPEPRPAGPFLQGIYAYAGVTGYWRARHLRLGGAPTRRAAFMFAYWRTQSRYALTQLMGSHELTEHGQAFCGILAQTLQRWCAEAVPAGAQHTAYLCAVVNRVAWRLHHHVPEPEEVDAAVRAWCSGTSCPPLVATPAIRWNPLSTPPTRLAQILEQAWVRADPQRPLDAAEAALAGGDYGSAATRFATAASTGDDEAWIGLAAALAGGNARGWRAGYHRPDLLRAMARLVPEAVASGNAAALARWIEAALPASNAR